MKEHAKKAFAHDIELFGKTVSTVAIAALFLIGAGSAAVLQQYGSVSGTATVENQALTVSQSTFSYDGSSGITPPETFVETVEVTNNNQEAYEDVDFTWSVNVDDKNVQTANVFDVSNSVSYSTTQPTVVSYDETDGEVIINVTDYSNDAVVGVDTDDDGTYDFHIDAVSSGDGPDYYAYEDGSWSGSGHYDWTQKSGEHRGVHYVNPSERLDQKSSFSLTIDAERLGSEFAYDVQDGGEFVKPADDTSAAVSATIGDKVTSSETSVSGDSTSTYLLVTEFEGETGSGDYETTVTAKP